VAPVYLDAAFDLGLRMGKRGINLVYGGASVGLMGRVALGVHEAGGRVTGVLPEIFLKKDIEYLEADELIVTKTMRERKAIMDERSDAFIVLPGGVGTLEEAMEIVSMRQLQLTRKLLVFINTNNFYDGLFSFFREMIGLEFAKPETMRLFAVEDNPQTALDFLVNTHAANQGDGANRRGAG